MDNISVEIETVNPSSFASSQLRQKQKYKVFLHEFDKWLKYGNGKARSQLYYKFSQKLQNVSDDITDNFQKLVENRKEQSQQSNLSYYNFVTDRNKGYGYQRKKILKFKKDLIKYFLPITDEIRNLRNDRLEYSNPLFYNEFKISHKNQLSLIKEDISIPKATLKTMHNIFGAEDTYIKDIISGGFWSVDADLKRSLQADVLLLPKWNSLFLLLGFEQDILVLEDGFFCIGKALSDLSGMINLKGLATYEQSNLIQTLTGLAIQFLSMREIELFVGKNAKLYNDLSLTYELLKIPKAIAVDTLSLIHI